MSQIQALITAAQLVVQIQQLQSAAAEALAAGPFDPTFSANVNAALTAAGNNMQRIMKLLLP